MSGRWINRCAGIVVAIAIDEVTLIGNKLWWAESRVSADNWTSIGVVVGDAVERGLSVGKDEAAGVDAYAYVGIAVERRIAKADIRCIEVETDGLIERIGLAGIIAINGTESIAVNESREQAALLFGVRQFIVESQPDYIRKIIAADAPLRRTRAERVLGKGNGRTAYAGAAKRVGRIVERF